MEGEVEAGGGPRRSDDDGGAVKDAPPAVGTQLLPGGGLAS